MTDIGESRKEGGEEENDKPEKINRDKVDFNSILSVIPLNTGLPSLPRQKFPDQIKEKDPILWYLSKKKPPYILTVDTESKMM